jgi:hypothetical protein
MLISYYNIDFLILYLIKLKKKTQNVLIKYRTLHDPLESRRFTASLIAKKPELSTI